MKVLGDIVRQTDARLKAMKKVLVFIAIATMLASCKNIGKSILKGMREGAAEGFSNKASEIIAATATDMLGQTLANSSTQRQISTQGFLVQVASETNKSLPMMVDRETQLYNVGAQENVLVYNYILVNYASWEVDQNEFIRVMNPTVTNSACSRPELQTLWQNGISLDYSYSGNDHKFIERVIVTPSDCGY